MLGMKSVASMVGSDSSYRLFDDMPISVMLCELDNFRITYINESTRQNLKKIEHVLPVKVDALIGLSIDIFHKNPQHQRRLLSDPKNLPHKARITIGGETLDLTVTAMTNSRGRYTGPMLTWELATEKARLEIQTERLLQMLDNMPINIMMCDTDFNITYINQTSLKTLDTVKHLLPVRPDQILGNSFDIFHKNPAHQRRIVGDPKNLPHAAKIKLGPETLDLRVSGLTDKRGTYTGAMLSWSVVTGNVKLADDFEKDVKGLAGMLASASTQMQGTARSLTTTAEFVNQRSASAASASEELSSSVNEISRQVSEASRIARMAVEEAEKSDKLVAGLVTMAQKIGDADQPDRRPDQPACTQRHDRVGARRRGRARLRCRRIRSEGAGQPDRQGHGGHFGADQRDAGRDRQHRHGAEGDLAGHRPDQRDLDRDRERRRGAGRGHQGGHRKHQRHHQGDRRCQQGRRERSGGLRRGRQQRLRAGSAGRQVPEERARDVIAAGIARLPRASARSAPS